MGLQPQTCAFRARTGGSPRRDRAPALLVLLAFLATRLGQRRATPAAQGSFPTRADRPPDSRVCRVYRGTSPREEMEHALLAVAASLPRNLVRQRAMPVRAATFPTSSVPPTRLRVAGVQLVFFQALLQPPLASCVHVASSHRPTRLGARVAQPGTSLKWTPPQTRLTVSNVHLVGGLNLLARRAMLASPDFSRSHRAAPLAPRARMVRIQR